MTMTAVERFSARHDDGRVAARRYAARLPATAPGPGRQYAFEVDLDACSGCKACVTACHSMNDLDPGESWRAVGVLLGTDVPYQQTVTSGCHHCVDPACMSGCPVDAYEKDPITGIVRHLDDQCIGCRYCTLTCPYEVPRFNERLGIVRKCDLCSDRLEAGEAPACVQGCPTGAIAIALVDVAEVGRDPGVTWPLPESPSPTRTRPTTVYRSTRPIPAGAVPADHFEVRPSSAHLPLAVMLVLSQLAVGAYLAGVAGPAVLGERPGVVQALAALTASIAAMAASVTHLGRPRLAWKAIIGLRHSWISREILALSLFTGLTALHAIALLAGGVPPASLAVAAGAAGLVAVGCSVAIYATTGRRWWRAPSLTVRFGAATVSAALCIALLTERPSRALPVALVATTLVSLAVELTVLRHLARPRTELGRTATLLGGELLPLLRGRVLSSLAGGVLAPILALVALDDAPAAAHVL
ncbi:MAG: formate dehydrogenase iron-sulfur subunit, partial [Actinomycetota bacterium]|nr:formate dehydrogenase iron-sulfur subunit [Actinomycetota bacterium]